MTPLSSVSTEPELWRNNTFFAQSLKINSGTRLTSLKSEMSWHVMQFKTTPKRELTSLRLPNFPPQNLNFFITLLTVIHSATFLVNIQSLNNFSGKRVVTYFCHIYFTIDTLIFNHTFHIWFEKIMTPERASIIRHVQHFSDPNWSILIGRSCNQVC